MDTPLDAALVGSVVAGQQRAKRQLFERYGPYVRRIVARLLGGDNVTIEDVVHDSFVLIFRDVHKLKDAEKLKPWLASIAVNVSRKRIRSGRRRSWLSFLAPEDVPEVAAPPAREASDALRATYNLLSELDADERIAFALRFIEGMELKEIAGACGVSLATIKRRLRRAEDQFVDRARSHPILSSWLEGGERWGGAT